MKMQIKNRFNNSVIFECEIEKNEEHLSFACMLGICIKKALKNGANLRGANLRGADLSDADLSGADLRGANLRGADLRDADLRVAYLTGADLSGADLSDADLTGADLGVADLSGADLSGADLRGANLSGADLSGSNFDRSFFRDDLWAVLSSQPSEAISVLKALEEGRVNGSTYTGSCACLVGTIANSLDIDYHDLEHINPDSTRPAEQWFLQIKKGDTPENSEPCRLAAEWTEMWIDNMQKAFGD